MHSLGVGGLENGVVNLVNATTEQFRHSVICMTTAGPFARRLPPDVDVHVLGKSVGHDPRTFVNLVRVLRRTRPDVVHSRNWATFDAVMAARLAGIRAIIHGEHGRDIADPEGRNVRRNRYRRLCAPLVTRFVTVSDELRDWLVRDVGLSAKKIITIHNGVDTERYAPRDLAAARRALGLPRDALVVGAVGRLDPVKDHATLVGAFASVLRRVPAILMIVGDGPCRRDLERRVRSLQIDPHVRLLGERDDVPVALAAMDVFVLPSIAEGISNTVLEAMATALPVVVTRIGGNPELVEDGVNGMHVPREDSAALAAAITAYLEDDHLRVLHGKSARERVLEHFSLQSMVARYASLYRDVAGVAERSA
jgi:sugar transferase (PEP-CTERM/EpsH1 system associated)